MFDDGAENSMSCEIANKKLIDDEAYYILDIGIEVGFVKTLFIGSQTKISSHILTKFLPHIENYYLRMIHQSVFDKKVELLIN